MIIRPFITLIVVSTLRWFWCSVVQCSELMKENTMSCLSIRLTVLLPDQSGLRMDCSEATFVELENPSEA